ncbi:10701_t:CDS:2 [Funneliformis caledonium]|uniref:10701_t:CDS:1 n=1 Tax=Funneliformis caledonium TaxID=1117310 RepID=A0A9N9D1F6_9GLOM|nr:10701_t:CDS:2 [Funneliformis caledonium]
MTFELVQELDYTKKLLNNAKEKLDRLEDRLEELRNGTAQPTWNGEVANLESKEKSLETDKKNWSNQLAMLQTKLMEYTQPGKRKLDLDDGNEGGDRKKVPDLTSAQIIMKRIMELPEDPDVYSNPKNSLSLPFPFLGSKKPVERFAFNDDEFFTFMGRREFKNVLDEINKLRTSYYMEMFIYGTMGYGKSYILSAITCYLFRVKKRVVYLPDCRDLSFDPVDYIKSALFLTYVNDLEEINRISLCETLGDIVDFFKSVDERLYFIIDQVNALDGDDTGITPQTKIEIRGIINKIRNIHFCIKSASANNEWALRYKRKQTNEIKMALYGGLKEDEMLEWWVRHGHLLDHDERENQMKEIEDITGCVPLFLRYFLESYNDNSDETFDFRKNHLIENLESIIKPNLDQFSLNKFVIKYDQNRYVEVMTSFMTNTKLPIHKEDDYDHRYFYVKRKTRYDRYEVGHYICGLTRNYIAEFLYERSRMNVFTDVKWINSMKMFKDNPSVLGFFMEKACIASISKYGLMVDKSSFKPDRTEFFSSEIAVREKTCTFFIPYIWNHDAIDGLLLLHKKEKKSIDSVHVIPIQVTITKPSKHSDSEQKFFDGAWKKLKLANYGENVKVSFVWITCRSEDSRTIEQNFKKLREQIIEVNPSYNREVIAFRNVNKDIDDEFLFSDRDI